MARKKHELTEQEYEIYQKIHGYEEPVEVEEGKIRREKSNYVEKRNKGKSKIKQVLRNLKGNSQLADEEEFFDEEDFVARRELSNARVHRQRLKGIRKFEGETEHER